MEKSSLGKGVYYFSDAHINTKENLENPILIIGFGISIIFRRFRYILFFQTQHMRKIQNNIRYWNGDKEYQVELFGALEAKLRRIRTFGEELPPGLADADEELEADSDEEVEGRIKLVFDHGCR